MLRIYIVGVSVLCIAIIANVIAGKLGLDTWYDFGPIFFKKGLVVLQETDFFSLVWLFFLYPLFLGFGLLLGEYVFKLF